MVINKPSNTQYSSGWYRASDTANENYFSELWKRDTGAVSCVSEAAPNQPSLVTSLKPHHCILHIQENIKKKSDNISNIHNQTDRKKKDIRSRDRARETRERKETAAREKSRRPVTVFPVCCFCCIRSSKRRTRAWRACRRSWSSRTPRPRRRDSRWPAASADWRVHRSSD